MSRRFSRGFPHISVFFFSALLLSMFSCSFLYGQQTPSSKPILQLSGTPTQQLQQILSLSKQDSMTLIQLWQAQIAALQALRQQSDSLNTALGQSKAQERQLGAQLSSLQAELQTASQSLASSRDSYNALSISFDNYRKATAKVQSDYRLRNLEWGAGGAAVGAVAAVIIVSLLK
ncbi:MAG TPA: hypothetical protein VFI02_07590 [Armatimonadota bacterium]|nr:hypothetical protein [Armatimonadota bacterium]